MLIALVGSIPRCTIGLGNASFLLKKTSKITYLQHTHTHTLLSSVTPLFCTHQSLACLSWCSDHSPTIAGWHYCALNAFAWQSNNMHLVNKGTDPVYHRLDFLDKAVRNVSPPHVSLTSIYRWCFHILNFSSQ